MQNDKKKYLNEQKKNPYETKLTILRIHFLIIFTHFSPLFVAQKTKNVNKELYSVQSGYATNQSYYSNCENILYNLQGKSQFGM